MPKTRARSAAKKSAAKKSVSKSIGKRKSGTKTVRKAQKISPGKARKSSATAMLVRNPKTGRMIDRHGPTFQTLTAAQKKHAEATTQFAPKTPSTVRTKEGAREGGASYFTPSAERSMSETHKSYCRCVAHVAAQQSDACLVSFSPGHKKSARKSGCYNPYPVCTRAVGRSGAGSGECLQHYDLNKISPKEVRAMALLKTGSADASALRNKQQIARNKK